MPTLTITAGCSVRICCCSSSSSINEGMHSTYTIHFTHLKKRKREREVEICFLSLFSSLSLLRIEKNKINLRDSKDWLVLKLSVTITFSERDRISFLTLLSAPRSSFQSVVLTLVLLLDKRSVRVDVYISNVNSSRSSSLDLFFAKHLFTSLTSTMRACVCASTYKCTCVCFFFLVIVEPKAIASSSSSSSSFLCFYFDTFSNGTLNDHEDSN